MQVKHTVSHQGEFIRWEEIPNGSKLQKFFQNYYHFVSLFVVVFYGKTEKRFCKGGFGNIHDIIKSWKTLFDQFWVVDVQLDVSIQNLGDFSDFKSVNSIGELWIASFIESVYNRFNIFFVCVIIVAFVEHFEKGDQLVYG